MTEIRAGGVAAMELVARDLKAQGLYLARALSFAGVEYEILEHSLTDAQMRIYDAYADAWAIIHRNLEAALEATRVVDEDSGDTLNRNAKAAALSIFEGTKQRFFAQLLLSMKLPSLIPAMEAALGEDHSVVVQLVSTAEAMLDRRLADLYRRRTRSARYRSLPARIRHRLPRQELPGAPDAGLRRRGRQSSLRGDERRERAIPFSARAPLPRAMR